LKRITVSINSSTGEIAEKLINRYLFFVRIFLQQHKGTLLILKELKNSASLFETIRIL